MAAGYFEAGKTSERAAFELYFRRLPENRRFVLAAGLAQAVDYLLDLRFTADEVLERVADIGDLFADLERTRVPIPAFG